MGFDHIMDKSLHICPRKAGKCRGQRTITETGRWIAKHMESGDENTGWSVAEQDWGVGGWPIHHWSRRDREQREDGWVLWAIHQITRQQWVGTQGRILECHPVSSSSWLTPSPELDAIVVPSPSQHHVIEKVQLYHPFHSRSYSAGCQTHIDKTAWIYVQFQESFTILLSIQTVYEFLLGHHFPPNKLLAECTKLPTMKSRVWSSSILRGFNWEPSPKYKSRRSEWLMPWFWRQRVAMSSVSLLGWSEPQYCSVWVLVLASGIPVYRYTIMLSFIHVVLDGINCMRPKYLLDCACSAWWCGAQYNAIYVTMRWSNICEYFSHERFSPHCKVCVTQSDVEPKAATAAAAALTTKITVTGKAGITFYWANAHHATLPTFGFSHTSKVLFYQEIWMADVWLELVQKQGKSARIDTDYILALLLKEPYDKFWLCKKIEIAFLRWYSPCFSC